MLDLQSKHGCLTVLDLGEEYASSEKVFTYREMRDSVLAEISDYKERRDRWIAENPQVYDEEKKNVVTDMRLHRDYCELKYSINSRLKKVNDIDLLLSTHYKCLCKCGKIHYYNEETLSTNPKYCFYPIPISTHNTHSTRAANATFRKKERYARIECVVLKDKSECIPSDDYCELYNTYKAKERQIKEEKRKSELVKLPRVYGDNYFINYSGRQFESLLIVDCYNEDVEVFHYNEFIVLKKYRCRCVLCSKEQDVYCSQFKILPPTEYGYHAYHGYWSLTSCDCHNVSSFEWIVNKILFENEISYQVEYSFPDLYGIYGKQLLRFDFAIINSDGSIRCLIECQGEQHYMPIEEFGGKVKFNDQTENDNLKREYVRKHNLRLIEISYKDKQYDKIMSLLQSEGIIP